MTDKERLKALRDAKRMIRQVEFSYEMGDSRRQKIFKLVASIDWYVAISKLMEELEEGVK